MRISNYILGFALFFLPALATAQTDAFGVQFTARTWRVEDGLPANSVTALAQASEGCLWVGTERGFARTDGVHFTDAQNSGAVSAMVVDSAGTLWVGKKNGEVLRYHNGISELVVQSDSGLGHIHSLQASAGRLHIGSQNGWYLWGATNGIEVVLASNEIGSVRSFTAEPPGVIWAGSSKGVWRYERNRAESFAPKNTPITKIFASANGSLRIASETAGLLEVPSAGAPPRRIWPVSQVQNFASLSNGEIWIASGGGVIERLPISGGGKVAFDTGAKAVNTMFEDREHSLWIGTEGGGIIQVRPRVLKLLQAERNVPVISCTQSPSGDVWFVARNGRTYRTLNGRVEAHTFSSHPSTFVESVLGTREGGLWLATRFDGVLYWPGRGDSLESRSPTTSVSALFEDRVGRVWLASARDGVQVWERNSWRAIHLPGDVPILDACSISEDAAGHIWIGLRHGGLVRWAAAQTQIERHELVRGSTILGVYADGEGNLWIATEKGLLLRNEGQFSLLTTEHGLHANEIHRLHEDLRGNLWFSSSSGIFRIAKSALIDCALNKRTTVHSAVFGDEDGLGSLEALAEVQPTTCRTPDGKLYFATANGVAAIDPTLAAALDAPIPTLIEDVVIDHKPLGNQSLRTNPVKIHSAYQHLGVRFTGLSLISPERTQFRFRMWGTDPDWVAAGGTRVASYGKLPAGQHRFEVMAQSREGTWPMNGAVLLFHVAPRYWETAWFRGFMLAGALAVIGVFWAQRVMRQREINAVREQITRDLHDDLGSNLGSIALLTEALQRPAARTNNEQLLQEINRIARQTLDGMRDTLWFVDPGKDSVADLVAHLRQLADSMLRNTPHEFRGEKVSNLRVPLELKRGIVLIFKESVYNAVRHSGCTRVDLSTSVEDKVFSFEVADDGSGFDPTNTKDGHGLDNMRHRAEKLRGKLRITSAPGRGTRVRFEVNLFDG